MSERPIIFSAPMVRALLEGKKSQTRRIVKVKLHEGVNPNFSQLRAHREGDGWRIHGSQEASERFKAPYAAGDRLWVREAWRATEEWDNRSPREIQPGYTRYEADPCVHHSYGKLRPPIFMPRWASRLTLTVTEVRVERLQDISEADAEAEGVTRRFSDTYHGFWRDYSRPGEGYGFVDGFAGVPFARDSFRTLWNDIHGADAWDANPWVAAISFEVHRANIDALPTPPVAPNLAQGGETP